MPSGIVGLDEMLRGGFLRGRIILVLGGPGAGKSMLCTQFISHGIKASGEAGIIYYTDGTKDQYYGDMASVHLRLDQLEQTGKLAFLDSTPLRDLARGIKIGGVSLEKRELSVISMIDRIKDAGKKLNAQRVVVDSLGSFELAYPDLGERRAITLHLIDTLRATNATCLLIDELYSVGLERAVQLEEYLSDGVIQMQTLKVGRSLLRTILISKMRGTSHETQPRPYQITDTGISVNSREGVLF